jgi:hypothetical protein
VLIEREVSGGASDGENLGGGVPSAVR